MAGLPGEASLFAKASQDMLVKTDKGKVIFALEKEVNRAFGGSKKVRTTAELAKLARFDKELIKLSKKYGNKILADAKEALRVNEYKILKNGEKEFAKELEKICKDIKQVITSKPHRKNFIYDMAHENKITEGSIKEALVACTAEDMNIVKKFTRAAERTYDFMDQSGNKWDVKTLQSQYINQSKRKLSLSEFASNVKKGIQSGEYILLDISEANSDHINMLKSILSAILFDSQFSKIKFIKC